MFLHVQITAHACCFISACAAVVVFAGKTQSQCGVVTVSSRVDYCCNYQLELVQLHYWIHSLFGFKTACTHFLHGVNRKQL